MAVTRVLPLVLSTALAVAAVVLYLDNRALRTDLEAARATTARAVAAEASAREEAATDTPDSPNPDRRRRGGGALLGFVGRMMQTPPEATATPDDGAAPPRPDVQARRERQQKRIRDLLGRIPGETDEQYRARVVPLVGMALGRPRQRLEDQRHEYEAAAELSHEQRGALDGALADARAELVELASRSVAAGELTPYRRNTIGVLNFVGGAAGIADGFDARLRQILGAEQLALLDQTGFDIIEYLGITTPWETVAPPPPAPNL